MAAFRFKQLKEQIIKYPELVDANNKAIETAKKEGKIDHVQKVELSCLLNVLDAQRFFVEDFGLNVGCDGFFLKPGAEQLERLRAWRDKTRKEGIEMPDKTSCYRMTLLMISLNPQRQGKKIRYLLGRGIGIEIALIDNVEGRKRLDLKIPYRTHSDFEFYATKADFAHTRESTAIFCAQEYFPCSKGFKNIPAEELHKRAQRAKFGNVDILLPELEFLCVDKINEIKHEKCHRPGEMQDPECLARQYELDFDRMKEIIKTDMRYAIKKHEELLNNLPRLLRQSAKRAYPEIKGKMSLWYKNTGREDLKPTHENIVRRMCSAQIYMPNIKGISEGSIQPGQIDSEGNLSEECVSRIYEMSKRVAEEEMDFAKKAREEKKGLVDELFKRIHRM